MQRVIIVCVGLMLLAGCKDKGPEMGYFVADSGYVALMPKSYVEAMKSLQNEIRSLAGTVNRLAGLEEEIRANDREVVSKIEVKTQKLDEQLGRLLDVVAAQTDLIAGIVATSYDPNDQALRYLAKPPAEWTEEHGDSERSLLLYNLAATSVIAKEALRSVGVVSRCVVKVHPSFVVTKDGNQIMDPNNYVEPSKVVDPAINWDSTEVELRREDLKK